MFAIQNEPILEVTFHEIIKPKITSKAVAAVINFAIRVPI
jgi:hypothetical protein